MNKQRVDIWLDNTVRSIYADPEWEVVGDDLAAALLYKDATNMVRMLDDDVITLRQITVSNALRFTSESVDYDTVKVPSRSRKTLRNEVDAKFGLPKRPKEYIYEKYRKEA